MNQELKEILQGLKNVIQTMSNDLADVEVAAATLTARVQALEEIEMNRTKGELVENYLDK